MTMITDASETKRRVGYQGMTGSNSERAAHQLAAMANLIAFELMPCISSDQVISQLSSRTIDFGVVALSNRIAGEVKETARALHDQAVDEVARCDLLVDHCLYSRQQIALEQVTEVYSHRQALLQCQETLTKHCHQAKQIAMEDTALAAKNLSVGQYDPNAAVICSRPAGKLFALTLLMPSIQDQTDNTTTFVLIRLA